jgi:hypothetical protein
LGMGAGPSYACDVVVGESGGPGGFESVSLGAGGSGHALWSYEIDGTFGYTCSCGAAGMGLVDAARADMWAFTRHVPLDVSDPGTGTESSGPWPSADEYAELMAAWVRVGEPHPGSEPAVEMPTVRGSTAREQQVFERERLREEARVRATRTFQRVAGAARVVQNGSAGWSEGR